jgi:tRNA(Arg) A34 adenosine deaminase TadA
MKLLHKAAAFAKTSKDKKNFYLCAIAERRDGIYVISNNSIVCEPSPPGHCEAKVLKKAGKGSILWVARIARGTKLWALSRPCSFCQTLIRNKRVERVYYTIEPGVYGVWDLLKNEEYVREC